MKREQAPFKQIPQSNKKLDDLVTGIDEVFGEEIQQEYVQSCKA